VAFASIHPFPPPDQSGVRSVRCGAAGRQLTNSVLEGRQDIPGGKLGLWKSTSAEASRLYE